MVICFYCAAPVTFKMWCAVIFIIRTFERTQLLVPDVFTSPTGQKSILVGPEYLTLNAWRQAVKTLVRYEPFSNMFEQMSDGDSGALLVVYIPLAPYYGPG